MIYDITPHIKSYLWFFVLTFLLPVGSLYLISVFSKTISFLSVTTAGLALVSAVIFGISCFLLKGNIVIDGNKLTVNMPLNTVSLQYDEVLWNESEKISSTSGKKLSIRLLGVGLPGFQSGKYELSDGSVAMVLSTSKNKVFIPTISGSALIIDESVYSSIIRDHESG